MRELPILFNGHMVRAILAGMKSQTRRVVRPQPDPGHIGHLGPGIPIIRTERRDVRCPYGQPGDRIWVREAFDPIYGQCPPDRIIEVDYRADWEPNGKRWRMMDVMGTRRWRPAIHMPRGLSRILLENVSVRVERLQDISEADALAEGVSPDMGLRWQSGDDTPRGMYGELWESINGPGSWDTNPWVWVVEFTRVTP